MGFLVENRSQLQLLADECAFTFSSAYDICLFFDISFTFSKAATLVVAMKYEGLHRGTFCVKNIHMPMMDKTWSTSAKQQMLSPIRIFTQEQRVCVRRNIIRRSILQEWVVAWTIGIRKRHGWNTASCGESQNIAMFLRQNLHKYIKVISVTGDRGVCIPPTRCTPAS